MHSNSLLNYPILTIQLRRALLANRCFVVFDGTVKKVTNQVALDEALLASQEFQRQTMAAKLNWLRAGVLGANDGIVSTAGLVMGVAGATTDSNAILIAGIAGLVAGSISMAGGEYTSVSAQKDSEKAALTKERLELAERGRDLGARQAGAAEHQRVAIGGSQRGDLGGDVIGVQWRTVDQFQRPGPDRQQRSGHEACDGQ